MKTTCGMGFLIPGKNHEWKGVRFVIMTSKVAAYIDCSFVLMSFHSRGMCIDKNCQSS